MKSQKQNETEKLYDEKKVAAALGIRRRFVCQWRETFGERNKHWTCAEGEVAITEQGLKALTEALGMRVKPDIFKEAELKKTGLVTVSVYFKPPNWNKLLARRADNKLFPEHVQVRDSSLFRIGDTFEAIPAGDGNGLVFYGRWPEAGW